MHLLPVSINGTKSMEVMRNILLEYAGLASTDNRWWITFREINWDYYNKATWCRVKIKVRMIFYLWEFFLFIP